MTRIAPFGLIATALIATAAMAQDTRGVRILEAEPQAPAPAPSAAPKPTPTVRPAPRATPGPALQPAPQPIPTATPRPAPSPAPCVRAFEKADLSFNDGASTRRKLADLLKQTPQRVVIDVAPFAADRIPAALDPWFAEIRDTGGAIRESEIKCTRGFSLGRLFGSLFGKRDPARDYAAIRGYDATLWTDAREHLVRQIELKRRPPTAQ